MDPLTCKRCDFVLCRCEDIARENPPPDGGFYADPTRKDGDGTDRSVDSQTLKLRGKPLDCPATREAPRKDPQGCATCEDFGQVADGLPENGPVPCPDCSVDVPLTPVQRKHGDGFYASNPHPGGGFYADPTRKDSHGTDWPMVRGRPFEGTCDETAMRRVDPQGCATCEDSGVIADTQPCPHCAGIGARCPTCDSTGLVPDGLPCNGPVPCPDCQPVEVTTAWGDPITTSPETEISAAAQRLLDASRAPTTPEQQAIEECCTNGDCQGCPESPATCDHFSDPSPLDLAMGDTPTPIKDLDRAARVDLLKADGIEGWRAEMIVRDAMLAETDKTKPVNPKDKLGIKKVPLRLVASAGIIHEAMAMKNGAKKYGPHNWREHPVLASIYVDACMRHILGWYDGEEVAGDSGVHHLGHARACLGILLDAMENDKMIDDRPAKGSASRLLKRFEEK